MTVVRDRAAAGELSFYDMMDVLPSAPSHDLKKGYKRASLKVHPDKVMASGVEPGSEDAEGADAAFMARRPGRARGQSSPESVPSGLCGP